MNNILARSLPGITTLALAVTLARAQTAPAPAPAAKPAPQPSAWDQWVKHTKNPVDWFTWGGDLRLRNEYFNNALSLTDANTLHEQDYFRYRSRLWASLIPATNLTVNARVAAEPRTFMNQSYTATLGAHKGTEWRYGIVDSLNAKWVDAFGLPLTISVGRQDIMFGEPLNWWLVADGTPGDGSWTFFLDSARVTWEAKDIKTRFDLVYIYQQAHPDEWLPTFGSASLNGTDYQLTEQNEQGVIFYVANKSLKNAAIDAYFIYKRDSRETFKRAGAITTPGDNADIYTLGAKISGQPFDHWAYSLEGAYQFGSKQDATVLTNYIQSVSDWRDISAYGAVGKVSYLFKDRLNNQASLVFEYLSGDNPNSHGTDEMFDVLWGRWPRWSELYIYSYATETRKIAQLNNVARIGANWSLSPMKGMTFSTAYTALFAPEETATRAANPALFSGSGNFRGHFLQTVLKHQFNKHVSGHLWGEFIWEGDYYAQHDLMTFLRAEVMFSF